MESSPRHIATGRMHTRYRHCLLVSCAHPDMASHTCKDASKAGTESVRVGVAFRRHQFRTV